MEIVIDAFVATDYGYGYGDGSGSGSDYGDGYGDGAGYGDGYGDGAGSGQGDCSGYGDGSGNGNGNNSGDGSGSGSGYGYGIGSGDGSGLKTFCGQKISVIDDTLTLIDFVHGNVAKGNILQGDFTTHPCFIVKQNNVFAHGRSLKAAQEALLEKLFDGMSTEERIEEFVKTFPSVDQSIQISELFVWHGKLTGSCKQGRESFARDHEIDIESGNMTIATFIELTTTAYQGHIIKELEEKYKEGKKDEQKN